MRSGHRYGLGKVSDQERLLLHNRNFRIALTNDFFFVGDEDDRDRLFGTNRLDGPDSASWSELNRRGDEVGPVLGGGGDCIFCGHSEVERRVADIPKGVFDVAGGKCLWLND